MGLDHPHTKAGVGEFGVAISGGVWVAIRDSAQETQELVGFSLVSINKKTGKSTHGICAAIDYY